MELDRQIALTQKLMATYEQYGMPRRDFLKLLATVGGGASLAALIAACGDPGDDTELEPVGEEPDDDTEDPAVEDDDSSETPDVEDDEDEVPDVEDDADDVAVEATGGTGILIAAHGQDIANIDPHIGHDYSIATTQKSLYDTLLRYGGNPPELENLLATDYESNEDATQWTFYLDDRAVFHDGSPVTAHDVAYSVGRLIRKNQGVAWMFANVMDHDATEVPDDHTIIFNLHTPFSPFPLIVPWLFVANEELVLEHDVDGDEGEAWLLENEAGSGPFLIRSWDIGDRYEFEAIPDYWYGWPEEGRLDGYIWRIMRESSSRRLGLLNQDVHMAGLSVDDFEAMQDEPGFEFISEQTMSIWAFKLNTQVGVTTDVNVRKAISYAMDYDAILDILHGRAELLHGPLPLISPYVNLDIEPYRHDMDKAREHLEMSDYPDGGFEVEYVHVTGLDAMEQMGLVLLDKLSQLNIQVNMSPHVWPDMVARMADPETSPEIISVQVTPNYFDPDAYLWPNYHSSQAGSYQAASHYHNPEVDELLDEARTVPDEDERREIYNRIQEILIEDAPEVWLHNNFGNQVNSEALRGYEFDPIMGEYFQRYWLRQG